MISGQWHLNSRQRLYLQQLLMASHAARKQGRKCILAAYRGSELLFCAPHSVMIVFARKLSGETAFVVLGKCWCQKALGLLAGLILVCATVANCTWGHEKEQL